MISERRSSNAISVDPSMVGVSAYLRFLVPFTFTPRERAAILGVFEANLREEKGEGLRRCGGIQMGIFRDDLVVLFHDDIIGDLCAASTPG